MKKALTIVILCITFLIIYFLQMNLFSWVTIAGVKPNLFIIFILFIGLFSGRKYGLILGAVFGFLIDVLGNNIVGASSIAYSAIGFLRRISRQETIKR